MVCHFPTAASKWNPIEHRLFNHISLNWAGKPLRTYETMLAYIRSTTTATGLKVKAELVDHIYQTRIKVSDAEMATLNLTRRPYAHSGTTSSVPVAVIVKVRSYFWTDP